MWLRIISGTARGLKLQSLDGLDTRPTLDNVKEAIFSMLFLKCREARVLDLFAGSGALGIEALSRGAESAVFVDANPKACSVVKANLEKAGFSDKAVVLGIDAKKYLQNEKEAFDIIFLDPPYALGLCDEVLELIRAHNLIKPDGLIICEFDNGTNVNIANYKLVKDKRYGRVCVSILEAQ